MRRSHVFALGLAAALAPTAVAAAQPYAPCQCRYAGERFEIGTVMCLAMPGGSTLARCDMEVNVTSWTVIRQGCVSASAAPTQDARG